MRATLSYDVDHAVLRVLFAVRRNLAPLDVERGHPHAAVVGATSAVDVHHTALGMVLAVRRLLAAPDTIVRPRGAIVVQTAPHVCTALGKGKKQAGS